MGDSQHELIMPRLGVNDDTVTVAEWVVNSGDKVTDGQLVANLETTKAVFELIANKSGFIYPLVEEGEERMVQKPVAIIMTGQDDNCVDKYRSALEEAGVASVKRDYSFQNIQITKKARELVLKLGIDPKTLPTGRIVREKDILRVSSKKDTKMHCIDPFMRVVIYGASQGGLVISEMLQSIGGFDVVAFIDDDPAIIGTEIGGLTVWSGKNLGALINKRIGSMATHIANRDIRKKLISKALLNGMRVINVIDPKSIISPSVRFGVGNIVKAGAIIGTESIIGNGCIIDNGSVIPHHNTIGDYSHIAPGVSMGGDCIIGEKTLIGIGATVASRVKIGNNVIVAPGSCVVCDLPDNVLVEGGAARIVGKVRS